MASSCGITCKRHRLKSHKKNASDFFISNYEIRTILHHTNYLLVFILYKLKLAILKCSLTFKRFLLFSNVPMTAYFLLLKDKEEEQQETFSRESNAMQSDEKRK